MKKALLRSLNKSYWIGTESSPDGLPVFTPEEVEILKRSRDTITPALLETIYNTKKIMGGTLEDISRQIQEAEEMNQSPREEIGYVPPSGKTDKLATCRDIISQLKYGKKEEEKDRQPKLF